MAHTAIMPIPPFTISLKSPKSIIYLYPLLVSLKCHKASCAGLSCPAGCLRLHGESSADEERRARVEERHAPAKARFHSRCRVILIIIAISLPVLGMGIVLGLLLS